MPGVVDRLATAETAAMLADDRAVLADYDAVSIGLDLDWPPNRAGRDRGFVIVNALHAGLRHRCLDRVEAIEWSADRHEMRSLRLEDLPDRAIGQLGVLVRLGVGDAAVEQQPVQLVVARHPQPRRKETLAHQADLVLDLPLLPAGRRRAGDRIDQVMAAHP